MGVESGHRLAVVHLTDRRAVDIINCDHHNNCSLLEDYCDEHNISFTYCSNNEAVKLLMSIGGAGLGVFTNVDAEDKNECLYRKGIAQLSQRELLHIIGGWVIVEPIEVGFDIKPENHTLVIG